MLAFVQDKAITLIGNTNLLCNFISYHHGLTKKFLSCIMHAKNMILGNNKKMDRCLRVNVFYNDKVIILIDLIRRQFTFNNSTENISYHAFNRFFTSSTIFSKGI